MGRKRKSKLFPKIEKILNNTISSKGENFYLVKWEKNLLKANSWELEKNLKGNEKIIKDFRSQKRKKSISKRKSKKIEGEIQKDLKYENNSANINEIPENLKGNLEEDKISKVVNLHLMKRNKKDNNFFMTLKWKKRENGIIPQEDKIPTKFVNLKFPEIYRKFIERKFECLYEKYKNLSKN